MLQYTPPVHGLCINMSDNGRCLWTDSIWRCCVLPLSALNPFSLSLGSWQISRWKAFSPPIRTPSTSSRVSPSLQGESGEWSDYINIHFLFVSPTHLDCGCMPDMLWESHNHIWFTSCMLCVRCLEVFLITFCHIPVTVIFFLPRGILPATSYCISELLTYSTFFLVCCVTRLRIAHFLWNYPPVLCFCAHSCERCLFFLRWGRSAHAVLKAFRRGVGFLLTELPGVCFQGLPSDSAQI